MKFTPVDQSSKLDFQTCFAKSLQPSLIPVRRVFDFKLDKKRGNYFCVVWKKHLEVSKFAQILNTPNCLGGSFCNFHQQALRSFFCWSSFCKRPEVFSRKTSFLRKPRVFWIFFVWKRLLEARLSKLLCGNLLVVYYKRIKIAIVLVFVIRCFWKVRYVSSRFFENVD